MSLKKIVISIGILFIGIDAFSQSNNFPKVVYVNNKEGITIYLEPSVNSEIIARYVHGERVIVYDRNDKQVTINGIRNYWFQVRGIIDKKWYNRAWIFGGYLTEQLPEDVPAIIGYWDVENRENYMFRFSANGDFVEGVKQSDMAVFGKWTLNENKLNIIDERGNVIIDIVIINRNEIILNYTDGNKKILVRNFNVY
jgi:hypothetical protein